MVRAQLFRLILVAAFSVSQLASVAARSDLPVASSASINPDYAPLVDSVEADYLRATADLTQYKVAAEMTPVDSQTNARITGRSTITYVNHTGAPLTEIYFRLYPNSAEYAEGEMTVSRIRVDGQTATSTLGQDDTLLTGSRPRSRPIRAAATACSSTTPIRTPTRSRTGSRFSPAGIAIMAGTRIQ
jgi:hypothetical protein